MRVKVTTNHREATRLRRRTETQAAGIERDVRAGCPSWRVTREQRGGGEPR